MRYPPNTTKKLSLFRCVKVLSQMPLSLSKLRDESSQLAAVDLLSSVFRPNTLEIDHRRFDISVTEPSLHCSDINTVTQMVGSESVPECMQEEGHAVRSLS